MRVLWCDDELDLLDLGCYTLKYSGHDVFPSTDCLNIINMVAEVKPDVIIMDHNMFEKDGVTIIKQLKASEHAHIPVLLCTANDNPDLLAAEAGADGFIAKPFRIGSLRDKVASFAKAS